MKYVVTFIKEVALAQFHVTAKNKLEAETKASKYLIKYDRNYDTAEVDEE